MVLVAQRPCLPPSRAVIPRAEVQTHSGLAARCAAIASAGAGLIHLAVVPAHWMGWAPTGLFLAGIAVLQLMWACVVWSRPWPLLFAAGVVLNAGTAALQMVSRTSGLPFGTHAVVPESVDTAGICVLLLECYVVMGAAWAWMQHFEPEVVPRVRGALVLLGANAVIAGTVFIAVASSFQGHGHHRGPIEAQRGTPANAPAPIDAPAPGQPDPGDVGLPVTDMALNAEGDHQHP